MVGQQIFQLEFIKNIYILQKKNVVIGVIGIKNSGKSFILKRILNNPNFKEGFLVDTYGISCIFSERRLAILDTQGIDKALLKSSYNENNNIKPKNNVIKSIIREQKVCELLLLENLIFYLLLLINCLLQNKNC